MATGARDLTKLQRIIRLGYEMQTEDRDELAQSLLKQRAKAWRGAIEEEAHKAGVTRKAQGPRGRDLDELRQMSVSDAQSIYTTYNRALENEIQRLYTANPRGNRRYYIKNLDTWTRERAAWKNRQITLQTNKTARYHAQQRFWDMNGARERTYRFSGPAPVCDDCAAMFAAGVVDQNFVDATPTPLHPNCPHEWKSLGFRLNVPKQDVWMG